MFRKCLTRGDLLASARSRIHKQFGDKYEIAVPVFTNVAQELAALASKHRAVVAVYPLFPTQAWWPGLRRLTRDYIDLGSFKDVFEPKKGQHSPQSWRFCASRIDLSMLRK